jgi:SAM-dependent methyltransferase
MFTRIRTKGASDRGCRRGLARGVPDGLPNRQHFLPGNRTPGSLADMNDAPDSESTTEQVRQFWESHYQQRPQIWSGNPNAVLVAMVSDRPAGTALDLGCGEGGDALWLAARGWRVTAVDVSVTALDRAAAHAADAGLADRIEFRQHDLGDGFPSGTYDLVSAQFLQSPVHLPRTSILRAAAAAVAPGGMLLIVEHGAFPPWSKHHDHTDFPTPRETLDALDLDMSQWRAERIDSPERVATGPEGQQGVLIDNIVALVRAAD